MNGSFVLAGRIKDIALLGAAIGALFVGSSVSAYAGEPSSGERSIDRVVNIIDQKTPVPTAVATRSALQAKTPLAAAAPQPMTVSGVIPLPTGVTLKTGETVHVNYSDGSVVHKALSAGCTVTYYAGLPYMNGNSVQAAHSIGVSSGCSGSLYSTTGSLYTYRGWVLGDSLAASVDSGWVYPNQTAYFWTWKTCANSTRTQWWSQTNSYSIRSARVTWGCQW